MGSAPRMTLATQAVLRVFLSDPVVARYGFDVAREAGITTGSLYTILVRMEKIGWLTSAWEEVDKVTPGRPRRRYYRLTAEGMSSAKAALEKAMQRVAPKSLRTVVRPI